MVENLLSHSSVLLFGDFKCFVLTVFIVQDENVAGRTRSSSGLIRPGPHQTRSSSAFMPSSHRRGQVHVYERTKDNVSVPLTFTTVGRKRFLKSFHWFVDVCVSVCMCSVISFGKAVAASSLTVDASFCAHLQYSWTFVSGWTRCPADTWLPVRAVIGRRSHTSDR